MRRLPRRSAHQTVCSGKVSIDEIAAPIGDESWSLEQKLFIDEMAQSGNAVTQCLRHKHRRSSP